jgi:hypothetical protein
MRKIRCMLSSPGAIEELFQVIHTITNGDTSGFPRALP